MTRRVLITGSRHWTARHALFDAVAAVVVDTPYNTPIVIVHGACLTGADRIVKGLVDSLGLELITQEPHPADWKRYGKRAGPLRNQEMVDLGADICLAFPLADSSGTFDCMSKAKAAGIPVVNYGVKVPAWP